ncbi:hypothetical protein Athai_38990 [Actinocatenispora thailandica]|uniref:Uncharacterized protein n=1 Tax=Actinocatenispora thailandica TaxID=227318 RepID=A0A7R7HYA8_9ACTN|nr:hypothetical protein [Actinocatenispora thailandica]BCJ36396.1 hypothetical protein Athai_38990 [Actinocatenispora thailandica]
MTDENPADTLARRYRRWLLAYPRVYRRERGAEILGTLLDAAEPGRTRPSGREAMRLLRYGLGRRMADAGIRGSVVATVAAVLGGLCGIALGSWISWQQVDPMAPDKATATRLARTVLPVPSHDDGYFGRHTFWNPYSEHTLHGGTGVRVGSADFTGAVPPHADYRALAHAVAQRMRSHGWRNVRVQVDRPEPNASPPGTATVSGTRDGYLAAVSVWASDEADPTQLRVGIRWDEPASQIPATIAGGVVGALFGALFGLFTATRIRRCSRARRRSYVALCVATLLLLAPACLANLPTATGSLAADTQHDGPGPAVFWGGFVVFGAEPLAILSVVPALAILITCGWPRVAATRTRSRV